MTYIKNDWQNLPSTNSPIEETPLDHIENGIEYNDQRLNGTKPILNTLYANDFKCRNLWNSENYKIGMIDANGDLDNNTSWGTSFVEVEPSTTYTFQMTASAFQQRMVSTFTAKGGTLIARAYNEFTNDTDTYTFTTPSNCTYIGISWRVDLASSNRQLELGSTATTYVPHKDFENEEIYSTEEIVIGKWTDGRPLYRKVVEVNTPSTANSFQGVTTLTNCTVINVYGYISLSGAISYINTSYGSTSYSDTYYDTNAYSLNMRVGSDYINKPAKIVLEYTKTTD